MQVECQQLELAPVERSSWRQEEHCSPSFERAPEDSGS